MFQGSYIPAARLHLDMDGTLPMCLAWQWGWQSPRTSGRSTFASQLGRISGMKTFVFKSILVGARANLLWDQDISGSYYGANIQHHVDTDRTPFILEMTQIWSIYIILFMSHSDIQIGRVIKNRPQLSHLKINLDVCVFHYYFFFILFVTC